MSSTTLTPAAPRATARTTTAAGLFIVLLAQLMLVLDSAVMNVGLPHIATDLHFGPASLSWVLNGYALAFGGLLLLGGRLGDVFGRLSVFWIGLAVFTLFSLLGGLATEPWMLVTARALQGVGAAIAAPSVLALITTSAPNEAARIRGLALFTAVSSGGAALGMLLGGVLTDLLNWRWTLFINVPIGIAVLLTVRRYVVDTPRRPGRFDVIGAVTSTGAAATLVWTLIKAPEHGWLSAPTILGLVLAVALAVALVATEARHSHPLLRLGLLRSRTRVATLLTMAALYGGMLATFFLMVQYFEEDLGYGPLQTGFAFLPIPLSVFTMSRITPRLVARFRQPPIIVAGTAGVLAAFLFLGRIDASTSYWTGVFPALLVLGISMGGSFMPITSLALQGVEPEHAGSASGLLQTMQQLGGAVGLAVVASVFASHAQPGDFLAGAHAGFAAAAIIAALALASAASLLARPRPVTSFAG
ncbi:MFS transporter [Pimelobacter simplex]|uniref:Putative transmembrane efflux protein n=1 Tax=Nocardioides simplex TaxID=2045 RepID=A0A0A1DQF5_NOCSI|nr:MFS transporter [Pimelobacter simplex]AIY18788.1 putative transmembrane efflux protein [Pimelobacter simplex]GEB14487.1 MFS transporter [Pimelobacter simplex]SFM29128.1 drug resistance transporter, EmrB/QacA subfamily [Pimelobacter simplex]